MNANTQKYESNVAIQAALTEMNTISQKRYASSSDKLRFQYLSQRVAALRSGFSPDSLDQARVRAVEADSHGELRAPEFHRDTLTDEQRAEASAFREFATTGKVEARDTEGSILGRIGSYSSLGTFVPTEFFRERLPMMLKEHSPLFDPETVTHIDSSNGRPLVVPYLSDTSSVAVSIDEAADASGNEQDIAAPAHAVLGATTYRSPIWTTTLEALSDIESAGSAQGLFEQFVAQRIALGVGADLLNSNGASGKFLGLLPSLVAAGVVPITAQGSAANTGGSETGANSIGTQDLARLYFSVDKLYRNSPKAFWLMADTTAQALSLLLDRQGRPVIDLSRNPWVIMGREVKIDLGMPSIGPSNTCILFGDFSFWVTRSVHDQDYIRRYVEAPNRIEFGEISFRAFCRYSGALLYGGVGNPPIRALQNHS